MSQVLVAPGQVGSQDPRIALAQMSQMLQVMQGTVDTLQGHERRLIHVEASAATHGVILADVQADIGILKTQMNSAIKIKSSEKKAVRKAVASVVYRLSPDKVDRPQHFVNVHYGLREYFDVSEYADIPLSRFQEAIKLIATYDGTGKVWWRV